jgi:hypothetical protein
MTTPKVEAENRFVMCTMMLTPAEASRNPACRGDILLRGP